MLCSFPFNDDLGTPPTWRPYSWKKKRANSVPRMGRLCRPFPPYPNLSKPSHHLSLMLPAVVVVGLACGQPSYGTWPSTMGSGWRSWGWYPGRAGHPYFPLHERESGWHLRVWSLTGTCGPACSTTSLHELAMLMSLTSQPCERWQELGFGRATRLYRRTQITLEAARLPSAHRRPQP